MLVSMIGGVVTAGHVGIATLSRWQWMFEVLHPVCAPEMDMGVYAIYKT